MWKTHELSGILKSFTCCRHKRVHIQLYSGRISLWLKNCCYSNSFFISGTIYEPKQKLPLKLIIKIIATTSYHHFVHIKNTYKTLINFHWNDYKFHLITHIANINWLMAVQVILMAAPLDSDFIKRRIQRLIKKLQLTQTILQPRYITSLNNK